MIPAASISALRLASVRVWRPRPRVVHPCPLIISLYFGISLQADQSVNKHYLVLTACVGNVCDLLRVAAVPEHEDHLLAPVPVGALFFGGQQ